LVEQASKMHNLFFNSLKYFMHAKKKTGFAQKERFCPLLD